MTDQTPAVTPAHPPEKLMRVVNPLIRRLLRTPLAGPMREQMMVVNVTGRKTGRRYSIPLSAHQIDGALYALTSAPWKNNFRDGSNAEVLHGGKTTTMRGELITDPGAVAQLFERGATGYGAKKAQQVMGVKFRDDRIPTVEEFKDLAVREKIVAIRFT
jgi:hypothetical protein